MFENMELTVLSRDRWRVLKFGSCGPKDLQKKSACHTVRCKVLQDKIPKNEGVWMASA